MKHSGACPACDAPDALFFLDGADQRIDCPNCGELFFAYETELDDARALVAAGDPAQAVVIAHRVLECAMSQDVAADEALYERLAAHLRDRGSAELRFRLAGTARVLERFTRPGGSAEATPDEARLVIEVVDQVLAPKPAES